MGGLEKRWNKLANHGGELKHIGVYMSTVDVDKLIEVISDQRNAALSELAVLRAQLSQAEEENIALRAELEKSRTPSPVPASGGGVGHP